MKKYFQISIKTNNRQKLFLMELSFQDSTYTIKAINSHNHEMGYAIFSIDRKKTAPIWIHKLETNEKYRNQKVGTALIQALDYFASENHLYGAEGKYYPTTSYAKPLYEKNGYSIEKDGYETIIFKVFDHQKIQNELIPNITPLPNYTRATEK